jgi:hypothetical protein
LQQVKAPGLLRIAVVAAAVVLTVIGVIYLVVQCRHVPAPLPGREAGSTKHRVGFAVASFVLAAVVLGLGAFGNRARTRSG